MKRNVLIGCLIVILLYAGSAHAAAFPYRTISYDGIDVDLMPLIGFSDTHKVKSGETLLDIARYYGLGYNEIAGSNPRIDPWIPDVDEIVIIPTMWILPPTKYEDVVINIPEMRLYRFFKKERMIKTYPVGIGQDGFHTPVMDSVVTDRQKNPTWFVPPYARDRYEERSIPPGEDNPLGDYWIGLAAKHMGIHGTNIPWGVGRRVSHGCLRMYPEHIEQFFNEVDRGVKVEVIYEPIKIGISGDRIYMEAHPDHYSKISDYSEYARQQIERSGLFEYICPEKVKQCINHRNGMPTQVGEFSFKGKLQSKGGSQ